MTSNFAAFMAPLPRLVIPLGFSSKLLKPLSLPGDLRVLPAVNDLGALSEAITAYALTVGVIGPDWHHADLAAARELLLDNAVACVEMKELTPASLRPAILSALEEHARLVETPFGSQFLHMLPDPVYFKDRHGRFLAGNQALARSFKLTEPSLLIGRSDADFLVASFAQKTLAEEQEIVRTGQPLIALSEKATYEQQETSWWLTWKSPLRDSTGRIIGTFGFSRDQTDLKTTEIALTTERHLLEVLLTGLPDAVFIKDREGRFLLANQMVAYWMGNSPTSLRGQRDVDVYPPEIALAFRKDEEAVMVSGMPMVNREERVVTPDGRELYLLTTKLPYRNKDGEIVGIIGISRNVTTRRSFDVQMKLAQAEMSELRKQVAETATLRAELARLNSEAASRAHNNTGS